MAQEKFPRMETNVCKDTISLARANAYIFCCFCLRVVRFPALFLFQSGLLICHSNIHIANNHLLKKTSSRTKSQKFEKKTGFFVQHAAFCLQLIFLLNFFPIFNNYLN
jgi:hypothetical protein